MEQPPNVRAIESMRPETARALIEALTALVKGRYPYHVTGDDPAKRRWRAYAAAMVADSISTVEGIAHLAGLEREADAHSLLRDLIEVVITFAWLGIDPEPHIDAWLLSDKKERVKTDNAMQTFGEPVLEPAFRAQLDQEIAAGGPPLPGVADRAKAADKYWTPRIDRLLRVVPGGRVFELLYELMFRYTSSFTHSMPMAVNKLIEPVQDGAVVVLEDTTGPQRPLTFAPSAFGVMLYVASETQGWPATHENDTAFDRVIAASKT
jgi:Family of unknown function (DUF5677)